ncbi:Uma2 family endonuclease [Kitasatospora kazusensis]|uniref:Uma2 family endonuclease n=1 Tax=Kitasatospora kazusensis TaxID=407974 RepID=A0ABP5LL34_9ACTN
MSTAIDDLWATVGEMFIPEGYRVEIIEGNIVVSPQSEVQSRLMRIIVRQLEDQLGHDANITLDVPVDFPGYRNGYAPDLAVMAQDARVNASGRYEWADVDAVIEIVSASSVDNDYLTKPKTYAKYSIPVYLIVDPLKGTCRLLTDPVHGKGYQKQLPLEFGDPVTFMLPDGREVSLETERFPRN